MTRSSHVDKFKTPPANHAYRTNHEHIFGTAKGAGDQDQELQERLRRDHHKRQVADGKKDAQYYLDHEVRVSSNPNYQPKPQNSEEYKDGWDRIFNKSR